MSRIGNKPITVPEGVQVTLEGNTITVKGPKGTLTKELHSNMKIALENNVITVTRPNDEAENRSLHGLTRTLINNMVQGVVAEYTRGLIFLKDYFVFIRKNLKRVFFVYIHCLADADGKHDSSKLIYFSYHSG